jgi:hypothetical protein
LRIDRVHNHFLITTTIDATRRSRQALPLVPSERSCEAGKLRT